MSKRQFKSHASSSRAALGAAGGGFGGFGSLGTGSSLSYLTEPPNLSSITNANVVVSFKNLSKKDSTTKSKALEDLIGYVRGSDGPEESILEAWVKFYPRLAIDNSRRVRELSHVLQYELLKSARKRMEKFIPKIVGTWLAGTYDRDRAVARAATDGITSFLDTNDKVIMFWKRCQAQILEHAQESINETPQTLSDERSMSADDVQAKYFRVTGSSISLVLNLLEKLGKDDIVKQQDKYEDFLSKNKRLWTLASSEDAFVRRATGQLLIVCLEKQTEVIENELELISSAFIAEALRSPQSSSAVQLVQALEKLTTQFPHAWTTSYKGKKPPLSKLRIFVEKGSQGCSPTYWQSLRSLFHSLPSNILPTDVDSSLDFLHALRQGIGSREEPRSNAAEAWFSYFESAKLLASKISDPKLQGKLFQESLFPIFEQYLHPTAENSKWTTGNNSRLLAKAFEICAAVNGAGLQQTFAEEWQRLTGDFLLRLQTSLPEQSKDHQKSQTAIAAEGHRWFSLIASVLQAKQRKESTDLLVSLSNQIISTCLDTVVKRNGKPYSAAATVEGALRLAPSLMEVSPESVESISTFVKTDLPKLITSPSSTYLISILNLFRSIPGHDLAFEEVWQSAINQLLEIPDQGQKWKVTASLISNEAVVNLAQKHHELQGMLFDASMRAIEGNIDAWLVFEGVITFSSLTEDSETKLLDQLLKSLDAENAHAVDALKAIEFIFSSKPDLLRRQSTTYVSVITKLLALTELSDSTLSTRAGRLRSVMEASDKASSPGDQIESPILHVIRENLETASPQSLAIETLVDQAGSVLKGNMDALNVNALLPDPIKWMQSLRPALEQCPNQALGVMRPFAGAVFLVHTSQPSTISPFTRDLSGYSPPLRMAMYTVHLLGDVYKLMDPMVVMDILYLLNITSQVVEDQLDMNEENKLFASATDPDIRTELRDFVFASRGSFSHIIPDAKSWRDDFEKAKNGSLETSGVPGALVYKLLEATTGDKPIAFYATRALSSLLQGLVNIHGWHNSSGDAWLQKLDVLKPSTNNILAAISLLTGLQENLTTSQLVSTMCNRLISDVTGVSAQSDKTLGLLVLLNTTLSIYDEGDVPVAQNRLVFAVKQILSWVDPVSRDSQLASEMFRALHRLLPAINGVYGSYWETALGFCISTWELSDSGVLTDESIPMVGMSLKLYTILRTLDDANDDLEDALRQLSYQVSHGMLKLLQLRRSKESLPLTYTDDLLAREVTRIPLENIKDNLSEIYPLVASDFKMVQSAAFNVLNRALPEAQQQLSVDVILEKRDAQLPEELLSLLLDAPSARNLPDDFREDFSTSIRAYLLSWHLVYDSYSNASYKVRNDYSDHLKSENCISPLLEFIFDSLAHAGSRQNISGFDSKMIRSYDMWQATDSESNECSLDWLLANIYYLCLRFTPSLAKSWWVDCKSKQTKLAVEAVTRKTFSPLVIEETLDEVAKWAGEQEVTDDEKELIIKISKRSREVFAGYEVDDMMMQLVIRLPESYPLEGVKVDGVNRVAVSEKKWISWLRITQGVITFSNGSITDGLNIFRKNVVGALKGQTECAICYSIISSDKKMPDKRCQTCKNLFHSSCLFKWFASSNQSTCPLCRNPFNYGPDSSRRALDRSRETGGA